VNRRTALNVLGSGIAIALVPLSGLAAEPELAAAIESLFGDRRIQGGRVSLKLPKLAESGNSVPLTLSIKPPGQKVTVQRACIFANRNPRPLLATVSFGPGAGPAMFSTNIRLNGTQDVIAIAEFSDRSLWRTRARVLVTVGACDALQTRY
jgi:sulfur-oxidizing protein SoxY